MYAGASQVALGVNSLPANSGDIRDAGPIPGSGRSSGGGHGNPLQYSCLEHPMDREAWWAIVHRVTKSLAQLKWLSTYTWMYDICRGVCVCVYVYVKNDHDNQLCFISLYTLVCALVTQSCLILCEPLDFSPPGSSIHGILHGKNTGVNCHFLLQGIFPTQGLNPGLLYCRQTLYWLSHREDLR